MRKVWRFLKKQKIELPNDFTIPFPGYISGEKHGLKGYMHSSVQYDINLYAESKNKWHKGT